MVLICDFDTVTVFKIHTCGEIYFVFSLEAWVILKVATCLGLLNYLVFVVSVWFLICNEKAQMNI